MKKILVAATSIALLVSPLALAQNNPPQQPNRGAAGAPAQRPGGPPAGRPGGAPQGRPSAPRPPTGRPAGPAAGRPAAPQPPSAGGPAAGRPSNPRPPVAGGPQRPARPSGPQRPRFARPLPPRGNQFWHRGHYYARIPGPVFVWPHGWHYRRWDIGVLFPPIFLTPTYFYNGYAALGLEVPPPGYAWVRFGPDLILVNLSTREVEDVVYGVFL